MPIPDFIRSLRSKIGTELLQVPTAMVFAYDDSGRLLLIQDKDSGRWSAPSGIIDPHELPSDAAVREAWEEAGVFVELTRLLGVFAGEHFSKVYDNGDRLAVVTTVFAAKVVRGTPRPDHEETSDARLFLPSEIDALPSSTHFQVIRQAVNQNSSQPYFKPSTWQPSGL
ncbi:MAG: Nudix hydrolase domain-containing protein [Nitrospira sp.]|nr:MAG: Nudix hydrolase domain-containing protein [Nitrospira sp.]